MNEERPWEMTLADQLKAWIRDPLCFEDHQLQFYVNDKGPDYFVFRISKKGVFVVEKIIFFTYGGVDQMKTVWSQQFKHENHLFKHMNQNQKDVTMQCLKERKIRLIKQRIENMIEESSIIDTKRGKL